MIVSGVGMVANDVRAESANKANQQQQAATDKAQASLDTNYQQSRQDLSPYIGAGGGAINSLSQMVGITPVDTALPHSGTIQNGVAGQMAQRSPDGPSTFVPRENYTGETAVPRTLSSLAQPMGSSYQAVVTPSGQTVQVPSGMVQEELSRGGRLA